MTAYLSLAGATLGSKREVHIPRADSLENAVLTNGCSELAGVSPARARERTKPGRDCPDCRPTWTIVEDYTRWILNVPLICRDRQ